MFNQEGFDDLVLREDIVKMPRDGLVLKSGRKSHWYANWRNLNDVYTLEQVASFVVDYCEDKRLEPDCFYGVPEGATQIANIVQLFWARQSKDYARRSHVLPMGRGKPKDHGDPADKYFVRPPRDKVLVLEDVTTTGGSTIRAIDELTSLRDVEVIGVVALTDRGELLDGRTVEEKFRRLGLSYGALSSGPALLPKAYKKLQPGEDVGRLVENEVRAYCGVEIKLV